MAALMNAALVVWQSTAGKALVDQTNFRDVSKDVLAITVLVVFFGGVLLFGSLESRRRQRSALQRQLLDKFSSAHDFAEFMQSPAGQKYVMGFSDAVTNPRNAILSALRTGFVLACIGIGFLAGATGSNAITFRIGWVAFAAGCGFLISAVVSFFLSKKINWKEQD